MDIYTIFLLQYSLFWCEILDIYRLYILLNGQLSHTIFVNMPGMRVDELFNGIGDKNCGLKLEKEMVSGLSWSKI